MAIRIAANVDWLFNELQPLDRFAAVASHGIEGVEILFPYGVQVDQLAHAVTAAHLEVALINSPVGDWANGDRGLAMTADDATFEASIALAAQTAHALNCTRVHVLSGNGSVDDHWYRYIRRMRWASEHLAQAGLTMCLEAINPTDMAEYALATPGDVSRVLEAIDHPNARMQLDLFHTWVTEGPDRVAQTLSDNIWHIDHVQIAGTPQRNEPLDGDITLANTMHQLSQLDYNGWLGLEYRPANQTAEGLTRVLATIADGYGPGKKSPSS